jgi:FixJ family two-component response regulator
VRRAFRFGLDIVRLASSLSLTTMSPFAARFSGDAASGQKFLRSGQRGSITCAILDLVMPDKSGLEVQQQLGARGLQIPIVLVSAHRDEELGQRASGREVLAVLRKPVEHEEFVRLVREAREKSEGR